MPVKYLFFYSGRSLLELASIKIGVIHWHMRHSRQLSGQWISPALRIQLPTRKSFIYPEGWTVGIDLTGTFIIDCIVRQKALLK